MTKMARIVGIHRVPSDVPVHLVELEVDGNPAEFDLSEITQEAPGLRRSDWQAIYEEQKTGENRIAFFFHFLDTGKPLLSSAGPLALPPESPIPGHLQGINYKPP